VLAFVGVEFEPFPNEVFAISVDVRFVVLIGKMQGLERRTRVPEPFAHCVGFVKKSETFIVWFCGAVVCRAVNVNLIADGTVE
jgi:hypothetical protein